MTSLGVAAFSDATSFCAAPDCAPPVQRSVAYAAFISGCEAFESWPQETVFAVVGGFCCLIAVVDVMSRLRRWRQR